MNKQLLILSFFLLSTSFIFAQTGAINGVVLEDYPPYGTYGANDITGIPNIKVILKATNNNTVAPFVVDSTLTNASGTYAFNNLATDFYEVVLPNTLNGYIGTYGTSNSVTVLSGISQNLRSGYRAVCAATVSLGNDKSVCSGSSMSISVTPNTFTSYVWSNGATTPSINITPSVSTSYSVTATDANGCVGKDTIAITVLDTSKFIMEIRGPDTSAFLSCTNKDVILKAQPDPLPPVEGFLWNTGEINQFITPSTPGLYSVTVTATNGCISRGTFNVIQNLTPPANVNILKLPNTNLLTCNITGIILEASSTTPGAQFKWSTGQTNTSITASLPNTYALTVTDPTNGCTATTSAVITQNLAGPNVTFSPTNPTLPCVGGSILLSANMIPNAEYNWVGRNNFTNTLTATDEGTYTLEVKDLTSGCITTKVFNVTRPTPQAVSLGADKSVCKGTSTNLNVTPNTFASYLWSNGATTPSINVTPSVSTSYSVTATDANGCFGKDTVVVNVLDTSNFILEIRPDTALFLSCTNKDVIVKAQPDGIVPVDNFTWSTGANAIQFITPQTPGIYSVTVTASNGCLSKRSITVTQNLTPPNLTVLKLPNTNILTCNITGIILEAASTTPATGFKWSTGETNTSITASLPNTYVVTATDPANGCTASLSTVITQNITLLNINILPANPILPCGGGNVTLTANLLPNVSYNWVGRNNGTNVLVATTEGVYTLEVTDLATGCKTVKTVTVSLPIMPTVSLGPDKTINLGASTTLSTTPNTFSSYLWNNGVTTSTMNVTPSVSTSYSIIVTDANGCTAKDTILVNVKNIPPICNVTVTTVIKDITCNNANDGKITVTAIGGTAPYTFSLNGSTPQTSNVFSNLAGSLNVLKVKDSLGCEVVKYGQNINNPLPIIVQTPSIANIACNGDRTGKIFVYASGGFGTLLYSIDGGVTFKNFGNFENLKAGNYSLVVKDGNNCRTQPLSITLTQPPAITFTTDKDNVVCFGGASGSIKVSAIGGTGTLSFSKDFGYTYQTDSILNNLAAGVYNIRVRDLTGCQSNNRNVRITQPNQITFQTTTTNPICFGGNDGKIVVRNTRGGRDAPPYNYSKDNGATWQNSNVFNNLSAGVYYIRARDGEQCVSDFVVLTVSNPTKITFEIVKQDVTCGFTNNGVITFKNLNGGGAPLGYSINNGSSYRTDPMFTNLTVNNYQALVKDNTGCISEAKPISIINTCPPTANLSRRNPQLSKTIPMVITEMIPNPVEDNLELTVYSIVDKETEFQFFDMLGRVIKTEKKMVEKGYNKLNFDCYELMGGVYQILTVGSYPRGVDYRFVKL
jgi:SprB repeat